MTQDARDGTERSEIGKRDRKERSVIVFSREIKQMIGVNATAALYCDGFEAGAKMQQGDDGERRHSER